MTNYIKYLLICITFILVIILVIKQCSDGDIIVSTTINNIEHDNKQFQEQLNNVINATNNKINKACEEGCIEAFQNINNIDNIDNIDNTKINLDINKNNITSYINNSDTVVLQLFYKTTCSYCDKFMPTWVQIINNLPATATYEEINCEENNKLVNENNITTVPTIILLLNNVKKIYMGDRSYNDINTFLKTNGVNIIQRTFEDFNNTKNDNNKNIKTNINRNCPAVTFDKQFDLEKDKYIYQIFNSEGQYGYSEGGYNNKLITPFIAAYTTVDSYLNSLPDETDSNKISYKNLNECALTYADNIINFGLCDSKELDNILQYKKNIDNGTNVYRVEDTDYSTNERVVNAIKNVCNL